MSGAAGAGVLDEAGAAAQHGVLWYHRVAPLGDVGGRWWQRRHLKKALPCLLVLLLFPSVPSPH